MLRQVGTGQFAIQREILPLLLLSWHLLLSVYYILQATRSACIFLCTIHAQRWRVIKRVERDEPLFSAFNFINYVYLQYRDRYRDHQRRIKRSCDFKKRNDRGIPTKYNVANWKAGITHYDPKLVISHWFATESQLNYDHSYYASQGHLDLRVIKVLNPLIFNHNIFIRHMTKDTVFAFYNITSERTRLWSTTIIISIEYSIQYFNWIQLLIKCNLYSSRIVVFVVKLFGVLTFFCVLMPVASGSVCLSVSWPLQTQTKGALRWTARKILQRPLSIAYTIIISFSLDWTQTAEAQSSHHTTPPGRQTAGQVCLAPVDGGDPIH